MAYQMRRTKRAAFEAGGVTWESFHTGVNQYTLYSACKKALVKMNSWRSTGTFSAYVRGERIGNRYLTELNACKAAARVLLGKAPKKKPAAIDLCFETTIGGLQISLEQRGKDRFRVTYWKEVKDELTYGQAATALGASIMHACCLNGTLDNDDE